MQKVLDSVNRICKSKYISAVMYLLFLCLLLFLYLFRDYWLVPARVFHIAMELTCMAVLIVFHRLHFNRINSEVNKEKIFVILCFLLYICLFLDAVAWIVNGNADFRWLVAVANGLVLILEFLHGALFGEYIFANIDKQTDYIRNLKRIYEEIIVIAFVIRAFLVCSGTYFTVDEFGQYIASNLALLSFFFIPIITLFVCGIAAGSGLKQSTLLTLLSYPLASLAIIGLVAKSFEFGNSLMTLSLSIIMIYCSLFADTNQANMDLSHSFQTYIADDALIGKDKLASNADSCVASLLFCNLHNFSVDMESMDPEDAVIVLNNFYSEMSSIIENNDGKLLEYPGYSLFCIFSSGDHASNAIVAANQIMNKLYDVNRYNSKQHYPLFRLAIGINTGEVILGNVGSHNHMRYTAIGKPVNIASRVSAFAQDGMIALTEYTKDACAENVDFIPYDSFIPKGVNKPINIYTIKR